MESVGATSAVDASKRTISDVITDNASDGIQKHLKTDCDNKSNEPVAVARIPRKKVVMLLSYSGNGYYGMLRNREHNLPTIEQVLFDALLKAKLIDQDGFESPQRIKFQRASRTDKGVSACRQIVSVRLNLIENMVEEVNKHLPPPIRAIAVRRVTQGFDAKNACDSRTYAYVMPTYALSPVDAVSSEEYRITETVLQDFNNILTLYKGTHNYHNFTSGRAADDASCKRYIIDVYCEKPFERDGIEWVIVKMKGQSFMLHQIRKMVGLAIAICRGLCTTAVIESCWAAEKLDIPKAPAVGLLLEEIHYDAYNKKYGNDGIHEPLIWSDYTQQLEEHKATYIYPTIIETEKKEHVMMEWLQTLLLHSFGPVRKHEPGTPYRTAAFKIKRAQEQGNGLVRPDTDVDGSDNKSGVPDFDDGTVSQRETSENHIRDDDKAIESKDALA